MKNGANGKGGANGANGAEAEAFDLVGVGFGPSNLAIATLLASGPPAAWRDQRVVFLDRKPRFGWHSNMLLDDTRMQICFLKDLITLKSPTSPYTFINFLKVHGRLNDFLNLQTFYPSRHEFHRYLEWVAGELGRFVRYGAEVADVRPAAGPGGRVEALEVRYRDLGSGAERTLRARNLIVAPGGAPRLPPGVEADEVVFHSAHFLERIERFTARAEHPYRFLVVGAGQSAAEIFRHLARAFPRADVTQAIRRFALAQADGNPLANAIFDDDMVEFFFGLPESRRASCLRELAGTNYSVVDDDLIADIYRLLYDQKVRGVDRCRFRRFVDFERCRRDGDGAVVELRDLATGRVEAGRYDAVVLATGYQSAAEGLLAGLGPHLARRDDGGLVVRRDYSVEAARPEHFRPKIFLQGASTEATHGLTSTLISVLPFRAEEILTSAFGAPAQPPAAEAPRDRNQTA